MEYIIVWIVLSVIVGIIAEVNGRMGFGYFMLSLILSPIIIGILVFGIGKSPEKLKALHAPAGGEQASNETHTRCPDCKEIVRKDARKCRHCGSTLTPS